MVQLSKSQDDEIGDGTTGVVGTLTCMSWQHCCASCPTIRVSLAVCCASVGWCPSAARRAPLGPGSAPYPRGRRVCNVTLYPRPPVGLLDCTALRAPFVIRLPGSLPWLIALPSSHPPHPLPCSFEMAAKVALARLDAISEEYPIDLANPEKLIETAMTTLSSKM